MSEIDVTTLREEILAQEPSLALVSFDSNTAWSLGCTLRALALTQHADKPCYISITSAGTDKPLFFSRTNGVTNTQTAKLNGIRNAVKYLEMSTWHAGHAYGGNSDRGGSECDVTPGGWPIRVKGVEGVIAVLIIHGLGFKLDADGHPEVITIRLSPNHIGSAPRASLDHDLIMEALHAILAQQQRTISVVAEAVA